MAAAAIKEWIERATQFSVKDRKALEAAFTELDAHLTLRSYIVGYSLTDADVAVWKAIRENHLAYSFIKQGLLVNVSRWFRYIEETNPTVTSLPQMPAKSKAATEEKKKEESGNFEIGLEDTSKGVVTRFPPEPSGYLHIGHAKAAVINDYFAHDKYKGTLILRFDDTNPTKEKEEFQDSIVEDLELLGIKPDKRTHTSDYFQELHDYCVQMIKEGTAYADDTAQEVMRQQRMEGIPSKERDASPDANLAHFKEMEKGSEEGKRWCIRAKISVDDPNKAMRDPVIYRCNPQPHHRTGSTWKIYPTYDFCCPIVDSIEGVTHALRTTEYKDRDAQYQWFLKALRLRNVYNWDFSRLNFIRTLLSKRKLTKFVDTGLVWGWDDPRMPTVRGVRRRGCTVEALREFILKQGPSKNIVNLDWTTFWATNKKYIDPIAGRYTAVDNKNSVTATVRGASAQPHSEQKELHLKNKELGTKKVVYSSSIVLDQADASSFAQDEEITLMNWGNAIVRSISRNDAGLVTGLELELNLAGDVKKTKKKVTWLSKDQALVPVELVDFDFLITKDKLDEDDNYEDFLTPQTEFRTEGLADENVVRLREGDIIQFDRKGYFRVDRAYSEGKPAVFFQIPTGKGGK
ncbi:putative Glutamyl-tRNA synthetase, cytoplasmic [Trichodelitschia bisporula]|uniref:glutamate--tRNA ligase n=1 Tax=Trichodelitschia bisporula TaxID=703511 RepID=A0A6G1IAT0_9PEZI|nr:putative Glutamyl-tRNA synthetase, cytoplasmic [Trichodelitschia bisporula]